MLDAFVSLLDAVRPGLSMFPALLGSASVRPAHVSFRAATSVIQGMLSVPRLAPKLLATSSLDRALSRCHRISTHNEGHSRVGTAMRAKFAGRVLRVGTARVLTR